jgi:hypothetical protein
MLETYGKENKQNFFIETEFSKLLHVYCVMA